MPNIKGVKSNEVKLLPARYSTMSDKMHHTVFEPPLSAERVILLNGPGATLSFGPRMQKYESCPLSLNERESEKNVKFYIKQQQKSNIFKESLEMKC